VHHFPAAANELKDSTGLITLLGLNSIRANEPPLLFSPNRAAVIYNAWSD